MPVSETSNATTLPAPLQHGVIRAPAARGRGRRCSRTPPCVGELEGVREQVLEHLHAAASSRVTIAAARSGSQLHVERQIRRRSASCRNVPLDADRARLAERDLLRVDGHRARLDLRQVEDVADQVQQVGARRCGWCARTPPAWASGCRPGCRPSCWPRIRMLLSGVRSSCDMLARNSDLYFDVSASSSAFSSSARRACSISWFLRSTSAFCSASWCAFCAELLVRLLQLASAASAARPRAAATARAALGPHRGLDAVQHDADAARSAARGTRGATRVKSLQRGQLDHRLDLALEQHRQHDHAARHAPRRGPSGSAHVFGGTSVMSMRLLLERALADQSLARPRDARGRARPARRRRSWRAGCSRGASARRSTW